MEKKLRHSKQRDRIYEYLLYTKIHPSADMIYEDLRLEMPNLSLGTVYRNLKVLEEMGKVRRVTTLQNMERYDAVCHDHGHFVCENCGCVKNLKSLDMEEINHICGADALGTINRMNITLSGICKECIEQQK